MLAALLAFSALAQSPTPQAVQDAQRAAAAQREAAEAAAQAAQAAAAEERILAERRVESARRAQAAERRLTEAEERLRAAETATATAEAQLQERAAALSHALPVMLRLALWPAESLLATPGPPEDALRGLLVLQGLSREMAAEAATLRATGAEAARRAVAAEAEAAELRTAQAQSRAAAEALEEDLAEARRRRAGARDAEAEAARRAEEAAARASSLEGALARLRREEARREAERQRREAAEARAAEAAEAAARAREAARPRRQEAVARPPAAEPDEPSPRGGGRPMPVAGQVTREFGASGEGGPARGMTLSALPGARVVSPCAGRVVFGSPFRSYGLLLIVDCGGGYHFVLAGLDRLDTAPGQRVLAGEPVGTLAAGGRASLYLELRHRGRPVDPRNWFAARG
ncbi:murein hydrolase activator EnvC family protein [Roseicella aerolata]|uniref:Peptidoglycan DD-metalloendopeptidase family protein n=1 Tax=Roseicella aerolata TaxID=2883479 RepID=A0A9X1IBP3_9PROT|nr:peptidoglycan DD-metalloendopeptidase family protein [Roseicella aerolata]MCB4821880.1 peptidoglycan DD-metalloendopeptidase family protein [Roseicella aerolata]